MFALFFGDQECISFFFFSNLHDYEPSTEGHDFSIFDAVRCSVEGQKWRENAKSRCQNKNFAKNKEQCWVQEKSILFLRRK